MIESYLPWIGFHIFIFAALVIDLGVFHRDHHEVRFREAAIWSVIWVSLAVIFDLGILYFKGQQAALEFATGYIVEWSLSVDNLFVFITIFTAFAVPRIYQHRVLFWGIIGALVMRAVFIFTGIALLNKFHWIIYVFGGFLLFTGVKLMFVESDPPDPRNHWLLRVIRKWLPLTEDYQEGRFFVKIEGKRMATPLFLVLLVVEASDLIFAVDSIPAILVITKTPFIVYTSNIFAILGLRSLYFMLAGAMSIFRYLRYGLACILVFIGAKMCLADIYHIPILVSLLVIVFFLVTAILASIVIKQKVE